MNIYIFLSSVRLFASEVVKNTTTYNAGDDNTEWNPQDERQNNDCADDICPHEHYCTYTHTHGYIYPTDTIMMLL